MNARNGSLNANIGMLMILQSNQVHEFEMLISIPPPRHSGLTYLNTKHVKSVNAKDNAPNLQENIKANNPHRSPGALRINETDPT